MKKLGMMVLSAALVLVLAGCGNSETKSAIKSQFEELDSLLQRAGTAVSQIDAAVAASENLVNAGFGTYYNRLASQWDSYAETVENIKELDESELDALLVSLQEAVNEAKPVVSSLEELAPEIEKLSANVSVLLDDLAKIIPLVTGSEISPDLQQGYTELATAYQGLEGQLNDTLAQAEGGGLDAALQALKQANDALAQLCEKASNLLASLQT